MTIPSVIWSAKLNQPLIRDDSGLCVALDKPLPLFYGTVKSSLDFFFFPPFPFSSNTDKGCNSIVTEGQVIVRGRTLYLHVDRELFLASDNSNALVAFYSQKLKKPEFCLRPPPHLHSSSLQIHVILAG